MAKKIYTVKINDNLPDQMNLWYRWEKGNTYKTQLVVHENVNGQMVPVFKLSGPPFFHVYPNHCTVIAETLIN